MKPYQQEVGKLKFGFCTQRDEWEKTTIFLYSPKHPLTGLVCGSPKIEYLSLDRGLSRSPKMEIRPRQSWTSSSLANTEPSTDSLWSLIVPRRQCSKKRDPLRTRKRRRGWRSLPKKKKKKRQKTDVGRRDAHPLVIFAGSSTSRSRAESYSLRVIDTDVGAFLWWKRWCWCRRWERWRDKEKKVGFRQKRWIIIKLLMRLSIGNAWTTPENVYRNWCCIPSTRLKNFKCQLDKVPSGIVLSM